MSNMVEKGRNGGDFCVQVCLYFSFAQFFLFPSGPFSFSLSLFLSLYFFLNSFLSSIHRD